MDKIRICLLKIMPAKGDLAGNMLKLENVLQQVPASGIDVLVTPVGDRNVVEEMRRNGYCFGGEQSGHIVFLEHNTTGDGIISALQVLAREAVEAAPEVQVVAGVEVLVEGDLLQDHLLLHVEVVVSQGRAHDVAQQVQHSAASLISGVLYL